MSYLETKELSVGYHGNILIHDINIRIEKGKILTLVGPNGAGKSTILKSITRHLRAISGSVYVQDRDMHRWSAKEMATHLAVVLTDRIHPELMTCQELVAMGRYPHTNAIGKLTEEDRPKVEEALAASAPGDRFQFVRTGYFVKDTKYPNTFNRIVGLKDSYLKK